MSTIEQARSAVLLHPDRFSNGFYQWINANFHIYEYFEQSAQRVIDSGYKHYSARTIVEVMRHRSNIREIGDGSWKINDHCIPDLSRLYLLLHPEHPHLFELRARKAA